MPPADLTIGAIRIGLERKEFSCREIVDASLAAISERDANIGAFLRIREVVRAEADRADARLAAGEPLRPLEGVPLAVKDNLTMTGEPVTAGSKILEPYRGVFTATAVARLQAAGALVVGQTNLDEFAMGASTENSAYQVTKNPWDTSRVPGGSSGGSAAAVAAGEAVVAIGSDTGGSIRQPAAFCGIVGMKPTYGRVSRSGLVALASSLDQVGPLARTVADAASVYMAMAGPDDHDATTLTTTVPDVIAGLAGDIRGLRIGLPKEFFGDGVDADVRKATEDAAAVYRNLGAEIVEVSVPHAPQALATYYVILPAEASSNLARYDGIRYGQSRRDGRNLADIYRQTRAAGFGPEVKRRIMIGTFSLSAGFSDAYYRQATRVRALLREEFHEVFDQVDVLLAPTTPTLPFPLGTRTHDPLTMYLADLLTVPANLANIPAISVPAGFIDGLPVGIQLMTREGDETTLFRAAAAYEQATDWHTRRPPGA